MDFEIIYANYTFLIQCLKSVTVNILFKSKLLLENYEACSNILISIDVKHLKKLPLLNRYLDGQLVQNVFPYVNIALYF